MQLNISANSAFFHNVLLEDMGICGDITTDSLINGELTCDFRIISKQDLVLAGMPILEWYFTNYSGVKINKNFNDGDFVKTNSEIITGNGRIKEILLLERVVLNFIQHLSGVATVTKSFVDKVNATSTIIADTRKTIPGIRYLQKYAVRCGGGRNHRTSLESCILIKDNHIAAIGSIQKALALARAKCPHYTKIIIECDTASQFEEAVEFGAEIIMLDNMKPDMVKKCCAKNKNKAFIEVSGGININNVIDYALAGADLISIGALTHSVKAADISLDVI